MNYLLLFVDGPHASKFLRSYDPDFGEGRGHVEVTSDPDQAQQFPDIIEAMEEWKRPSTVHPIRLSDGKPNRPMTAWSVSPVKKE